MAGATAAERVAPASADEAAQAMRAAGEAGRTLRIRGGATKLAWGAAAAIPDLELATEGLAELVEHNEGDLTAVLEAGCPLAAAQARFAAAGQMLALDPWLGDGQAATIGGVLAAGDSGPLRHRYGGPRDLLLGVTVVLSDGAVARAGGKVIKNVAGYDLGKLFCGSLGTLGLIAQAAVRLHPRPPERATGVGVTADAGALAAAAAELGGAPLELECFDVAWAQGRGRLLAGFGGATARAQADRATVLMAGHGLRTELTTAAEGLWAAQRAGQRAPAGGASVRVSGTAAALPRALRAARETGAALVGRAALGLSWLTLPAGEPDDVAARIGRLRAELGALPAVVLDAPDAVRERVDVWGPVDGPAAVLMRRVKARFDPRGVCRPGAFVGGI